MKVTHQLLENRQAALTIEVEDERVQKALQAAARRLANKLNIPGFRKGKAPYQAVLRAVGEGKLYEEAIDELGQEVFREALEESQLEPYAPAQMDDIQLKPLVFKLTVPLRPTVELGDYRSLRVPYTAPQVSDEQIDQILKSLQERHAVMEPVGEGLAELGQIAVLDIDGTLRGDSAENPEPFMHEHEANMLIAETTDFPFPGFIQHVVGMKAGEEKSFEMVIPDAEEDQELRGKTVDFKVKLQDLKARTIPPLDDAFAQTVGAFETLDALRDVIRAGQLQQAKQEADSRYGDECLQKLVEQSTIEFPSQMTDEELDHLIERAEQRLKDQKMSLDEFLNIKKQTRDEYRAEMRPRAEANIRRGLVMSELAVREELRVSNDEVTIMINMISAGYGDEAERVREQLTTDEGRQSLGVSMLTDKVMARLTSVCKGENLPLPGEARTAAEPAPAAETPAAQEPAAPVEAVPAPVDAPPAIEVLPVDAGAQDK